MEKSKKDDFLKPEIIQCDNIHLYALYDIARDLLKEKDNHLHYFKEMRDNLTHIYLVPHSFQDSEWYAASDNQKCHIGYRDFFDHTVTLMQIVRAAVIYLVAFIDEKERKRMLRSKTPAFSTGIRRHKPNSFGPKSTYSSSAQHSVHPTGGSLPRFQAVCVAWSWFRQNGVVSSRPPAGNASRWAALHKDEK